MMWILQCPHVSYDVDFAAGYVGVKNLYAV